MDRSTRLFILIKNIYTSCGWKCYFPTNLVYPFTIQCFQNHKEWKFIPCKVALKRRHALYVCPSNWQTLAKIRAACAAHLEYIVHKYLYPRICQIPPLALTPWRWLYSDRFKLSNEVNSRRAICRCHFGDMFACVSPIEYLCVCFGAACEYLCEGKRAFVFEVCGHRSMSVSIGRSFGRALGISIFSVALFLDARKKATTKTATKIASVCVWVCVRMQYVCVSSILLGGDWLMDWQTDGLTNRRHFWHCDQQCPKPSCTTFSWGFMRKIQNDPRKLNNFPATPKKLDKIRSFRIVSSIEDL